MTKQQTHTDLERDLADDYSDAATTRQMNQFDARLRKLEQLVDDVRDELGDTTVKLMEHRENYARNSMAGEEAALNTLAKAASARQRYSTPEGLMERGMKVLTDPSAVGVLESYVNAGQLAKAADLLADAEGRADKDDDDAALERTESQIKEHSMLASVSELGETVADLQHTLNALLSRIGKLEARRAAPAPLQSAATVAKAGQFGRRQVQEPDAANSVQGLQERLEAVFDSPAQVGTLSSMLQAGRVEEVRRAVEQAEVRHQAQMTKQARRTL